MKKPFVALLLLVGAAAMVANMAYAQAENLTEPGNKLVNAKMMQDLLKSRAERLHTSAGPDPDTVWFGHSYTDHWSATANYWNLYTGVNRPGIADPNNAIWDWDHSTGLANHGIGDSLAGWWPMRRAYSIAGGLTLPDASRPWWAIDIGNQANYVMNLGPGGKRTIGVVGVWHADPGTTAGIAVRWSPLSGTKSAWCGLRHHGDNTVVDQVTNNAFNQSVLEFNGESSALTNPTAKHFPGYGSQMDQMLYRDLAPAAGQPLNISFLYRTRMSTGVDLAAATRTGWFHGDPLAVTAGNFISSTAAGANAPIDSFMVYVGVPVNDAACLYSDGVTRPVYDPQRRWFSEVLRIFDAPYYEIFSTSGLQPADTLSATPTASVTIPGTYVDALRNAAGNTGNRVRLVFRVKTNRGFDDMGAAFSSLGRGAVQIDDVVVNASNIGDFEGNEQGGVNTIDNRTGASALTNWKSTGKPPAVYFHPRALADLTYNDLCGPPESPARFCNIYGTVISAGNYDDGERAGDSRFASDREVMHGMFSPTINLVTDQINNTPNAQGLTASIVDVTDDIYVWYDIYAGMFNLNFSGNAWTFGSACYPARMNNGGYAWGELIPFGFQLFNPEPQCFWDIEALNGNGVLGTINPSGVPDSLRIWFGHNQQCFRFAVSLGCNSADGCYFDNVSVGFADVPGTALHHAVLFANGVTTDVGSLGGSSEATALNTAGTVVGHFDTSDGSHIFRAFAWRNGVMQDLGTLGGARSDALDVGPGDVAVGWAENGSGEPRAFLWRNGTMSDLNDLLPAGSGWQLDVATAINDRGAIVGNGRLNGQPRAFMLMPPMDLWLNIAFHGNQLDTNIPNPHEAGTRLTVGSTVWANGPWTATGIKVVNVVSGPVEITAVRPGVSGGATCEQSGLTVTCTLRNFDYYRDVFIDLRATAAGIITHQAWIDASYPDPVPGNNSASETNRAVDLASFTLADSVVVGGAPVLGRVTLTSPVNPGGGTVPLRSSNPAVASVPSQFDVLPYCCDGLWREFYVTTVPVTQPVTVDVSAHYGLSTITLPLTILPSGGVWPYTGTPLVIPGTIEAEQFDLGSEGTAYHDTSTGNAGGAYRASGVDIEAVANTNDPSGGFNVGWLDDGEWLAYSVNVTTSSTYAVEARVACPGACGAFHLEVDGSDATGPIAIPATGGWQAWQTVRASVTLAAGAHRLRVVFHVTTPGGAVGNLDWIRFTPSATPTPFGGAPALIPGRIEAEAFDEGGEGVAYHDLSSENSGGASRATGVDLEPTSDPDDEDAGFNVGWIDAGEWLNYTVSVAEAGTYHLRLRVAAPADGGTLHLSAAGQDITGPLTIPDTGNWQAWIDLETSVNLAAGVQSLRVVFDARGSANLVGNLNFIEVTRE